MVEATVPFPSVECWCVYQGRKFYISDNEKLTPEEQKKFEQEFFYLKELGVLKGVHDLHFIWEGRNFATIEMKYGNNAQDMYQRTFTMHMERCGHKTATCKSVKQVRDQLIAWGLDCKNTNCIEPPPSFSEQQQMVANMHAIMSGREPKKITTQKDIMKTKNISDSDIPF